MNPQKLLQYIIGCILLLWSDITAAQSTTVITGRIADRSVKQVSLIYWQDAGISPAVTQDNLIQPDSFYFRLPLSPGEEVFFYVDAGQGYNFYGLIGSGDSIQIGMRGDSLTFGGRGAVSCRSIYAARQAMERIAPPERLDAGLLADYYRQQLQAGNQVLAAYQDSMGVVAQVLVKAHVLGEIGGRLLGTLWKLPPAPDSTLEDRQVDFYRRKILPFLPTIIPSDTTAMAVRYLSYLLQKAEAEYFVQHRFECSNRAIYEWLKTRYNGKLRDKLLAHALIQGFAAGNQQEEQEWCARDFLSSVQNVACKQAITVLYGKAKKGIGRGSIAPACSFRDQQGKLVNLQQFNGKVVLLHFYNGRNPILSALSEIQLCFNDQVSFVNICCEGNASNGLPGWLLHLDEPQQEVLSQYSITRFPSLIIISRNGKVFATRPPDPAVDHGTALANILYEALLQ
ncbi:TlpA family protein disulfide reductase [Chitinophaga sp. 30R24]|uniref:TlpA family protein disulfide reductase n=1 Tax=Chitinophaga sp. 30R24 TaxID=3248838 RepID=UPI003B8FE1DB